MKYLFNKNHPGKSAGLVQEFIDTAYDTVKYVADNLPAILEVAQAIEDGTIDDFLSANDIDSLAKLDAYVLDATILSTEQIDTLSKLNALVLDEEIASEAYVQAAVTGLYDPKGGYDADANTPDLLTGDFTLKGDTYQVTVAGTFYTATLEVGDQLTANIDDPAAESDWTILNRNIDSAAFATAEQGAKADTALQSGDAATPAQGVLADSALQPADNISELTNDSGFTDDQTPAEIAGGYNSYTPVVSQVDAEAATSTTAERWTPERVGQAIAANTTIGGGDVKADGTVAITGQINIDKQIVNDEIRFEGDTGANGLIQKNASTGRDELQIYSNGDASSTGSLGSGIHVYGNLDSEHPGGLALLTGTNDNGTGRLLVKQNGQIVIGNVLWDYWDNDLVVGVLDIKDAAADQPYLHFHVSDTQTNPEADITVTEGKTLRLGMALDVGGIDEKLEVDDSGVNVVGTFTVNGSPVSGGGGGMAFSYVTTNTTLADGEGILSAAGLNHTLPASPTTGYMCAVHDASDNAASSAINIDGNGETITNATGTADTDIDINMNGGQFFFLYDGTTWRYSYIVQTVQNTFYTQSRDITATTGAVTSADVGLVLYCSNAAAQTITIPDSLPIGFQFIIAWEGVGKPSVTMGGTETKVGDSAPAAQYKRLHMEKRSDTVWWGTA